MKLKTAIQNLVNKLPYVRALYKHSLNTNFPNGHYYSPVISIDEVRKREAEIWDGTKRDGIEGIELNTNEQLELLKEFSRYYQEIPFKSIKDSELRYYFENEYYSYTDGIILYSIMRHFKPKRIIEVGSGFSSAAMLDINDLFFANEIDLTFIEPFPDRLYGLMTENDKNAATVIQNTVQSVPLTVFEQLDSGDILFIDSTHVSKTGSDVNFILFEILPKLKNGVLIHFHDVFYPFEYPKDWIYRGFNWNEDYLLRAFLMYNNQFKIMLFSEYLHLHHADVFKTMPLTYRNFGGNLWIQKTT